MQSYMPIPITDTSAEADDDETTGPARLEKGFALSPADKWRLVKPMLFKYMMPLCELRYQFSVVSGADVDNYGKSAYTWWVIPTNVWDAKLILIDFPVRVHH